MYRDSAKVGLDVNCPINTATGELSPTVSDSRLPAWAGASSVRLNLVLGPWASPADPTERAGRTWFQTYDHIVDRYLERGLSVYALVGAETVRHNAAEQDAFRNPTPSAAAEDWIAEYARNFGIIADHFRGRIHIYESFNEPNDWHRVPGGPAWSQAWIHPYWFARMLQAVYHEVKSARGLDVTLVSGPVFTHDADSGTNYLVQTYVQGINNANWEAMRYAFGRYPLDGVGFHLYVKQDCAATPEAIRAATATRAQEIWDAAYPFEGETLEAKGLYISELGWQSVGCGQEWQARSLQAAYETLIPDWRVRLAVWFCLQDFGPTSTWGLYNSGGLAKENRKRAYDAFYEIAHKKEAETVSFEIPSAEQALRSQGVPQADIPALLARIQEAYGPPAQLTPGRYEVSIAPRPQYTNQQIINAFWKAGNKTWTLLEKAGLDLNVLASARDAPYAGPPIGELPNLTTEERLLIQAALPTPPPVAELDLWGKGMWIWQVSQVEGGAVQAIADKAKARGLGFVFVKIADGTDPYNGNLTPLVDALRKAGVTVWGWQYTYGERPKEEAEYAADRLQEFGLKGFVIDAEAEYEGHADWALAYMDALRSRLQQIPIGLSSFFLPDYHPSFPWREFLGQCDVNIPQVYWYRRDPVEALRLSLTQNIRYGRPILPTGAVYEMIPGAPPTKQDITRFLTEAESRGLMGTCFWSWQHASASSWDAIGTYDW